MFGKKISDLEIQFYVEFFRKKYAYMSHICSFIMKELFVKFIGDDFHKNNFIINPSFDMHKWSKKL